ncbi:MAG TPA: hypothetical protein V6D12_24150 [Candidatus Obscuribacterales bacterium]|jgi:hypothetical protein
MILSYWAFGESRDSLESIEESPNLSILGLSQLSSLKTSIGDSGKSHPMLVSKFSGVLFGTMVTHSVATPGLPCLLAEDCTYAITRESGGLPFKEFYIHFNMLK